MVNGFKKIAQNDGGYNLIQNEGYDKNQFSESKMVVEFQKNH